MGKKDASATKLPVDQYRKQIGESPFYPMVNQFVINRKVYNCNFDKC